MERQVNAISKACYYQIRNIGHIRRYITLDACQTLAHALITYRLGYDSSPVWSSKHTDDTATESTEFFCQVSHSTIPPKQILHIIDLNSPKHLPLTSYSRSPCPDLIVCHKNRYMERFSLPYPRRYAAQDKSRAASGHMESRSSVCMLFHFCRMPHTAYIIYGISALAKYRSGK